ncbi:MAG: sensor histidine kinase, partial [Longimicrobiales bacterium]
LELARNLMVDAVQRLRDADALLIGEIVRAERLSLLGTMTASIMHDLKNPLSVVSGVSQLLAMEGRDDHMRWAGMLDRAVVGITALVQDVLDYARGTSSLELGDVPADDLLRDLAELLAHRMSRRGVELKTEVEVTTPVRVDRQRFGRVLANLATNAVEAMPDGGTVRIHVAPRDGRVCYTVTDTGTGIPQAILPTLFEPFATHGKKGGTGLGMAIAKAIVEAHQGEITVSSPPGEGARFEIVVPG